MKKGWLLASVSIISLGIAAPAAAADLPAQSYTKAPAAVAALYNWTGFYVGLNAGGAFGRVSGDVGESGSISMNGFIGGAQLGYNWQINNIVFGLEADFQGSSQKYSEAVDGLSSSVSMNYFGTLRGRLGLAQDRWLTYITGGYAYQNLKFSANSPSFGSVSSNSTRGGYAVGAGFEYAFAGPWTTGLEYLYLDSGSRDLNIGGDTISLRERNHVVRAKLNYRF
jgi:outer membrane immunogenic protein